MIRKSDSKKYTSIADRQPLSEDDMDTIDCPDFLNKVKNKYFEVDRNKDKDHHVFKNDFMRQVYYLAKLGARDEDIADFFGVDRDTVDQWKIKNLDFKVSLLEGKWIFDMKVAESLGKRALGYNYTETEYSDHLTRAGDIQTLKKVTHKHMPPDVTAMIFWLKNRQKAIWADVNRVESISKKTIDIRKMDLTIFSEEERQLMKSIAIKKLSSIHGVDS